MYTAVDFSRHTSDAYKAGYESVSGVLQQSTNDQNTEPLVCIFVFSSTFYDQVQVLAGVRAAAGEGVSIYGASASGELTQSGPAKRSVVAMGVFGVAISARGTHIANDVSTEEQIGQMLAHQLGQQADDRALILFPDVLSSNAAEIVAVLQRHVSEYVVVTGGAAGDDFAFEKTYTYIESAPYSGETGAVMLSGDFYAESVVGHGWQPIGVPMQVTRAEGARVYEIDGAPAINAYEEYFGKERIAAIGDEPFARIAITYPLGVYVDDAHYIIATPITLNESDGSITFASVLPINTNVRLMMSTKDDAVYAATQAAQELAKRFAAQEATLAGVLAFSCIARERLFGPEGDREVRAISEAVGQHIPIAGFYTYGEVGPVAYASDTIDVEGGARLHNETIVLLGIGTRRTATEAADTTLDEHLITAS